MANEVCEARGASEETTRGRTIGSLSLDEVLEELGMTRDHGNLVSDAIDRIMTARNITEVEAFVALRWTSREERRSLVDSATRVVGRVVR